MMMDQLQHNEWLLNRINIWFNQQKNPVYKFPKPPFNKVLMGREDMILGYTYIHFHIASEIQLFEIDSFKNEVRKLLLLTTNIENLKNILQPLFLVAKRNIAIWNTELSEMCKCDSTKKYKELEVEYEFKKVRIDSDRNVYYVAKAGQTEFEKLRSKINTNDEFVRYSASVYDFLNETFYNQVNVDPERYKLCDKYPNCDCYNDYLKPVESLIVNDEQLIFLQLLKQFDCQLNQMEWVEFESLKNMIEPELGLIPQEICQYFGEIIIRIIKENYNWKMPNPTDLVKLKKWLQNYFIEKKMKSDEKKVANDKLSIKPETKVQFTLSKSFSKIDYIRIINALSELHFFQKEDETYPAKKDVMNAFGSLVGIDLSNYDKDLNKALTSNVTLEKNIEIFDKLKEKTKDIFIKKLDNSKNK